jgi:hypothetical protein
MAAVLLASMPTIVDIVYGQRIIMRGIFLRQ